MMSVSSSPRYWQTAIVSIASETVVGVGEPATLQTGLNIFGLKLKYFCNNDLQHSAGSDLIEDAD